VTPLLACASVYPGLVADLASFDLVFTLGPSLVLRISHLVSC